jgi:hypothetical protein
MPDQGAIDFRILADSAGDVLIVEVRLPEGGLLMMAEVTLEERCIRARGLHLEGVGITANSLGFAALRRIARAALERMDCDELIVEGGRRTTGAGPGRLPAPLRFKRAPGAAPPGD